MTLRRSRHTIDPAHIARGEAAERSMQTWLDGSQVPYVYLDQTKMTVPDSMRGKIKRPDYLVGIPGVGLVAFDVKSKTIYKDGLIFDLSEVKKLRNFARMFHLTVFFACLNTGEGPQAYWVRLDQLDDVPAIRRNAKLTLCLPIELAMPLTLWESFQAAFMKSLKRWACPSGGL